MTPQQIAASIAAMERAQAAIREERPENGICLWLAEIALQLAIANERPSDKHDLAPVQRINVRVTEVADSWPPPDEEIQPCKLLLYSL